MGLPYAIEYLLSLRTVPGQRLAYQQAWQLIIPIFPPFREITFNVPVGAGEYMNISYEMGKSPGMRPDAFYLEMQQYGSKMVNVVLSADWLAEKHDIFVPISQSQPTFVLLRNLTPLNQYYSHTIGYIVISNEEDWDFTLNALEWMGNERGEVAKDCRRLLAKIAGEPPPED